MPLYGPAVETVLKSLKTFLSSDHGYQLAYLCFCIFFYYFFFYFIAYRPFKNILCPVFTGKEGRNITFVFHLAENKSHGVNGRVKRGLERRVVNELV